MNKNSNSLEKLDLEFSYSSDVFRQDGIQYKNEIVIEGWFHLHKFNLLDMTSECILNGGENEIW